LTQQVLALSIRWPWWLGLYLFWLIQRDRMGWRVDADLASDFVLRHVKVVSR
jgi:hypothetical protein